MKIEEKLAKELGQMRKLIDLCLDAKDMTHTDYRSLTAGLERVGDIVLNRKERN